jgi:hypothetical protein
MNLALNNFRNLADRMAGTIAAAPHIVDLQPIKVAIQSSGKFTAEEQTRLLALVQQREDAICLHHLGSIMHTGRNSNRS